MIGNSINSIARAKPITKSEAIAIANRQLFQREFRPHYDQVVLRISAYPINGLVFGQPPPTVA